MGLEIKQHLICIFALTKSHAQMVIFTAALIAGCL
ncbi:hypothetical protein N172_02000 [Pantoea dispersa EGD-AAK13]|nr:hypothetical protein N172_02000 [Pantoea dispersa EGD-AAK13]KAF0854778.1 hypothetical protein Y788_16015 [Pantoea dispersa 625]